MNSIFVVRYGDGDIDRTLSKNREGAVRLADEIARYGTMQPTSIIEYIPAGWRSMETAPRDRQILGNTLTRAGPYVVYYCPNIDAWRDIDGNVHETREIDGWLPIPGEGGA